MARRSSSRATKGGVRRERKQNVKNDDAPRSVADVYDAAVADTESKARKGKAARRVEAAHDSDDDGVASDGSNHGGVDGVTLEYDGNDEEIDSDDAFASGDEEAFDGFQFRASKGQQNKKPSGGSSNKRKRDQSPEEEEEDEGDFTDYDEDDMMDIDALFDQAPDQDVPAAPAEEASDQSDADDDSDDEDDNHDAVDDFARQVDEMAGKNKDEGDERPAKRRKETAPQPEVEGSQAVSLQDLLAGVEDERALAGVRKNAQNLDKLTSQRSAGGIASAKGTGTLAAPLQSVHQERLDREAAYEVAKSDARGWQPTVNKIRDAEHLIFPLQARPPPSATVASLTAPRKEEKPAESAAEMESLLNAAGVGEDAQGEAESLAMAKLDPEEVKRRHRELMRVRHLMFRSEEKAKRASKIKSKAFRKQQRKDKEKQAKQNADLSELTRLEAAAKRADGFNIVDPDSIDHEADSDDEGRLKAERERALERATLKHKNTGKWAKQQLRRRDLDEGTRRALAEQLQRASELRAKVAGGPESSDEEGFDDDADDEEGGNRTFDQLDKAERGLEAEAAATPDPAAGGSGNKSGIMDMQFMRNARARHVQNAQEDLRAARKQLERDDSDASDEAEDDDPNVLRLSKNGGRAMYNAVPSDQNQPGPPQDEPSRIIAAPSGKKKLSVKPEFKRPQAKPSNDDADRAVADALRTQSSKLAPSKGKNSWLSAAPRGDAEAEEDGVDGWLTSLKPKEAEAPQASTKKKSKKNKEPEVKLDAQAQAALLGSDDEGSDSDSGGSEDEEEGRRGQQAAILAEAFAGEDVAAYFEADKAAQVAAASAVKGNGWDDEAPGWGEWGGKGVKASAASLKRKEAKRQSKEEAAAAKAAARKDAKLPHVVIDDAADKRSAAKYTVKDLPFPYTNKRQYEVARNTNLGREWNTQSQTMRLTLPKVQTKTGQVIRPLQRHF